MVISGSSTVLAPNGASPSAGAVLTTKLDTLLAMGDESIGMYRKADVLLHIIWNDEHLPMFVDDKYLVWFHYTDLLTLINPFTSDP